MKIKLSIILCLFQLIYFDHQAQIAYSFNALAGTYAANATPTVVHGAGVDDALSAAINIGFTFQYGCVNYTQFKVSSNGWLTFNTAITANSAFNNLNTSTDRPIIAPLWDDLETGTSGNVNYRVSGVTPNRILTVEWREMNWNYTATNWALSFQARLYETSNRIEFVYIRNGGANANVTGASASIGIEGLASGDYYSLDAVSATPNALKTSETNNLSSKPANNQVYRWDPLVCTAPPVAGIAVASPSSACTTYTTNLSLTGAGSGCGMTYQWQIATALGGPYTNIGAATNPTYSTSVSATRYFRCVLTCSGFTTASTPATASIVTTGACAICNIQTIGSLPFNITGQTTCGQGNDVTSSNVSNVCGSTNYYGGEDAVYSFVAPTTGQISVNLTSTGSYVGIMLYNGCPTSGGTCVGNSQSSSGNQAFCGNVTAGNTYYLVIDSWPSPTCNPYDLTVAYTNATAITCPLSTYTAATTTYSFENFVGTLLPTTDDVLFNTIVMLGFQFCYGGISNWGGYVASNSSFVFDGVPCFPNIQTNTYAAGGVATGFTIPNPAPVNGTSIPRNAVLGPWHDIDPSVGGTMRYYTTGVAPNRKFVVSFEDVPMYGTSCDSDPTLEFSGQIKLFETSNAIEIHIRRKRVCTSHNNGEAVLGLHNFDGTTYIPPVNATAHNAVGGAGPYNQWIMTNTAYRFQSPCAVNNGVCAVLPVEFLSFNGENVNDVNLLKWKISERYQAKNFILERSTDNENFEAIAVIKGNKTTYNYSYQDVTFKNGVINYYRIVAFDEEDKSSTTKSIPIGNNYDELTLQSLYPNPANATIYLQLSSKTSQDLTVNIKDMYGKIVYSSTHDLVQGITQIGISTDKLNSAVYILEVVNRADKVIALQKINVLK